jgi:hypothetical protein
MLERYSHIRNGSGAREAPAFESNPAARNCWKMWWALQDLNLEPTDYESAALTIELRARAFLISGLRAFPGSHAFRCGGNLWPRHPQNLAEFSSSRRSKARSNPSGWNAPTAEGSLRCRGRLSA